MRKCLSMLGYHVSQALVYTGIRRDCDGKDSTWTTLMDALVVDSWNARDIERGGKISIV